MLARLHQYWFSRAAAAAQIVWGDISGQQIDCKMRRDDRDQISDPEPGRGENQSKHESRDQSARALIKVRKSEQNRRPENGDEHGAACEIKDGENKSAIQEFFAHRGSDC